MLGSQIIKPLKMPSTPADQDKMLHIIFIDPNKGIYSDDYTASTRKYPNSYFLFLHKKDIESLDFTEEAYQYYSSLFEVEKVVVESDDYMSMYIWTLRLLKTKNWMNYLLHTNIIINGNTMPLQMLASIRDVLNANQFHGFVVSGSPEKIYKIPLGAIDQSIPDQSNRLLVILNRLLSGGATSIHLRSLLDYLSQQQGIDGRSDKTQINFLRKTTNYHLKYLVNAGFIKMIPNPANKREKLVKILWS